MSFETDAIAMRAYISDGITDHAIADRTGWDNDYILELKREVLSQEEVRVIGRRDEEVYAEYTLKMHGLIRRLQGLMDDMVGSNQHSAAVGAVKAQASLYDRVLQVGQDMGFIRKEPAKSQVEVFNMTDRELAARTVSMLTDLRERMAHYGNPKLPEIKLSGVTPSVKDGVVIEMPAPGDVSSAKTVERKKGLPSSRERA